MNVISRLTQVVLTTMDVILIYKVNLALFVLSVNRYSTNREDHSYIITFFSTCFIMPLGLIFYCYGRLLRKLQTVSKEGKVAHLSHFFPSTLFTTLHFYETHFSYLITLKWLCHTLMNIILFSLKITVVYLMICTDFTTFNLS